MQPLLRSLLPPASLSTLSNSRRQRKSQPQTQSTPPLLLTTPQLRVALPSVAERVVTVERPRTVPNSGLETSAAALNTTPQTPLVPKECAMTAGTRTFARASALLAQPLCVAADLRFAARTTAAGTAEAMALALL